MSDYILRAIAADGGIRAFFANTKEMVQEAFEIHKTSPVVSAALGRTLTAAAIMGSMLKSESDIITISIRGDGPIGGITVTADSKARVKGYVFNSMVDIPLKANGKLDVSTALGEGNMNIIKDIGLKDPYVGQIPLVSGEIAEDLTYYYAKSEQVPSSIALGVLVDVDYSIKQSGGFFIQLMPDADIDIEMLEKNIAKLPPITTLLEEGKTGEEILEMVLSGYDVKILEKIETAYYCNCSRERVEKALISIGLLDLNQILKEDKKANLHCHFCNKEYLFDENDLSTIIESLYTE